MRRSSMRRARMRRRRRRRRRMRRPPVFPPSSCYSFASSAPSSSSSRSSYGDDQSVRTIGVQQKRASGENAPYERELPIGIHRTCPSDTDDWRSGNCRLAFTLLAHPIRTTGVQVSSAHRLAVHAPSDTDDWACSGGAGKLGGKTGGLLILLLLLLLFLLLVDRTSSSSSREYGIHLTSPSDTDDWRSGEELESFCCTHQNSVKS